MQSIDVSAILPELLAGDAVLDDFINNINDNTLINAKVSHQIQFEQFIGNLSQHEPLSLLKLKKLLAQEPVEIRFLFAYTYSQFLQNSNNYTSFSSLSDFLYKVLIADNPERLHWL